MNLMLDSEGGKVMIAAGRSTPHGMAIVHATSAPAVTVLRSEFRPATIHIIGPAERVTVRRHAEGDSRGSCYDIQFTDLGAVRDLIDALETALEDIHRDPAQMALEVAS